MGGGNKRGFFAGSLIWFYLSERALFSLLEPARGSRLRLELMVSQPDGFIKRTDAAGPCQGQEGKGWGPALPGRVHGRESLMPGTLPLGMGWEHISPTPSWLKVPHCPL